MEPETSEIDWTNGNPFVEDESEFDICDGRESALSDQYSTHSSRPSYISYYQDESTTVDIQILKQQAPSSTVDLYCGFKENNSPVNGGSLIWSSIKCWTSDRSVDLSQALTQDRAFRVLISLISFLCLLLLNSVCLALYRQFLLNKAKLTDSSSLTFLYLWQLPDAYQKIIPISTLIIFFVVIFWLMLKRDRWVKLPRFLSLLSLFLLCRLILIIFSKHYARKMQISFKSVLLSSLTMMHFETSLGFLSIGGSICVLWVCFVWTYAGENSWPSKLISFLLLIAYHLLLLVARYAFMSDLIVTALITVGLHVIYHSAVWVFHAVGKLGWLGYDWDHPFILLLKVIWSIDGLYIPLCRPQSKI